MAWFAIAVVGLLAALGFALDRTIERALLDDLTDTLVAEARAVQRALPDEQGRLQGESRSLGAALDLRITVILEDGTVVADSERDPASMENHARRPEIVTASRGEVGIDSRTSETVGEPYRYVALPPRDGLIVRVALPLSVVQSRLGRVRALVVGGSLLAAMVGVAVVYLLARRLMRPLDRMTDAVNRMSAGDLGVRVGPGGTAELALLGEVLDRLAAELDARVREIEQDRSMRDSILSAMDEGVLLIEGDRVQYVNPAAGRMLGSEPVSLHEISPLGVARLVGETRERGRASADEFETPPPARVVQAVAVPIEGRGQVLLVLRDVTDARRVEAMRRDFVADASHELKTPVAAIQAAAETVRSVATTDPSSAQRFAGQLHDDAVRLSRLVSDLLDLSRLETRRPQLAPVPLGGVVRSEAERLAARFADAAVRLTVEVEADPVVEGDEEDLRLLARNLLENAARYTPRGGDVRVEVGADGDGAFLTVSDTGIGIPSRDLPRVFERFYRVDPARARDTGGTGLGLAIAKHVVEQHGGRLEVESHLGQGSTFTVRIPMRGDEPRAGAPAGPR